MTTTVEQLVGPPVRRDAVTHLGELGEIIEQVVGEQGIPIKRQGYTSRGVELRCLYRGKPCVIYLLPDNPHVKLSHLLEER